MFSNRQLTVALTLAAAWPAFGSGVHDLSARLVERSAQLREAYDYVIVGGGTSGLTVADRLTADGKYTVLVIEHGYLDNSSAILTGGSMQSSRMYNITSVPQRWMNNRTQSVSIGNVVGGCSAINGMAFNRGTSEEYDGWAELGGPNSTWNWEGMLPYFKKASYFTPPKEDVAAAFNMTYDISYWEQDPNTRIYASWPTYQNPGIIPMIEAFAAMPGIERPKDCCAGDNGLFWYPSSVHPTTLQRSYARTGHFDNISRDNYELITGQRVNKILFEQTTAVGVQFVPRNGGAPVQVKAKKEVILAAGAVHTPQVLQLSGIGPKKLLEKAKIPVLVDLPGVGQKFQDQAYVPSVAFRWGKGRGPPVPRVNVSGTSTLSGLNLAVHVGFPVATDNYTAVADAYAAQDPAAYLPDGFDSDPTLIAGYAAFQRLHAKQLKRKNVSFLGQILSPSPGGLVENLHCLSHGTININPANPEGEPLVDYRALSNPVDMDIMVELIKWMRKWMANPAFAEYEPIETSPGPAMTAYEDLAAWIRQRYIPTIMHPIGTAAKMPRELGGVVDEQLRVHGVERLAVIDASIMPTTPGGPTSQTVYAIAEKAADLIKARQ